jgi:hypothetical protein
MLAKITTARIKGTLESARAAHFNHRQSGREMAARIAEAHENPEVILSSSVTSGKT